MSENPENKMSSERCMTVCLCIEDLDNCVCDIVVNQLASGQLSDFKQPFHLMLVCTDEIWKLEDLRADVYDCAFPMVKEVSCHRTLSDMEHDPDIILILLANRGYSYARNTPTEHEFQVLLSLVCYVKKLSDLLSTLGMDSTKIIVAGDLSLTAASVMARNLKSLAARQLIAVDLAQTGGGHSKLPTSRCYSKAKRICETLQQWWTGITASAAMHLGIKYISPACTSSTTTRGSGYFFSAPVSLDGPMKFSTCSDPHLDQDHIADVKATTDKAFRIMWELQEQNGGTEKERVNLCMAHL